MSALLNQIKYIYTQSCRDRRQQGQQAGAAAAANEELGYYNVSYKKDTYGGDAWSATTMTHQLSRKDYGKVWVVIQSVDKACAARSK
mmetsp:Transcript_28496/g.66812  ORF Transcript_28496/g.66812 Transcript_28496/m.66812 type:complete len:87 (+) Transcript_28496:97-357(+)